jgi:hypothetical protein
LPASRSVVWGRGVERERGTERRRFAQVPLGLLWKRRRIKGEGERKRGRKEGDGGRERGSGDNFGAYGLEVW